MSNPAENAKNSQNKRKSIIRNGAQNKRRKTTNDEKIGNEIIQNKEGSINTLNLQAEMMGKIEEELHCNICTEILIKPTVLNCSHVFCEFCIIKWKKQQERCPMCRDRIQSQIRVLALEVYIDKALELLSPEQLKAREKILKQREQNARQKPRRSQRLKNRSYVTVTTHEALEDSRLHLHALIGEILLANHFTYD